MTTKQELIKKLLENSSITIEESFILSKEEIQFIPIKEYFQQPIVFQPHISQYPVWQPYCETNTTNNK